jgi:hypothetical protein
MDDAGAGRRNRMVRGASPSPMRCPLLPSLLSERESVFRSLGVILCRWTVPSRAVKCLF